MNAQGTIDTANDIRWTTLCHYADDLANTRKVTPLEKVNLGVYLIASVLRNVPEKEKFRWFAHAMQEMSSQSAGLDVLPVAGR